jgi:hypothetical protein
MGLLILAKVFSRTDKDLLGFKSIVENLLSNFIKNSFKNLKTPILPESLGVFLIQKQQSYQKSPINNS